MKKAQKKGGCKRVKATKRYLIQVPPSKHPPGPKRNGSRKRNPQQACDEEGKRETRGLASPKMSEERKFEIRSDGGRSAHDHKRAHEWTRKEAREAGRKGGLAAATARAKKKQKKPRVVDDRSQLDKMNDDKLARELKLGRDTNDAVRRVNESQDAIDRLESRPDREDSVGGVVRERFRDQFSE